MVSGGVKIWTQAIWFQRIASAPPPLRQRARAMQSLQVEVEGPGGEEGGRGPGLGDPHIRDHVIWVVSSCVGRSDPWRSARRSWVGGISYISLIFRPTYQGERYWWESYDTGETVSKLPSSLAIQICILIRFNGIQLPDTKLLSLGFQTRMLQKQAREGLSEQTLIASQNLGSIAGNKNLV